MATSPALIKNPKAAKRKLNAFTKHLMEAMEEKHTKGRPPHHIDAAKAMGLHYQMDDTPGIRRKRAGKSFTYVHRDGKRVRDTGTLRRIKALAIPPAWTDVWIAPRADDHLQATGMDAKGRKQYRYHPLWRQAQELAKYYRMVPFAEALPRIRKRVEQDLHGDPLSRRQVLAAVVRLLEETLIRIGNEEYAKENRSYGLSTIRDKHVTVRGSAMHFHFRGKSGKVRDLQVKDPEVAPIVQRARALPGDEVFQYIDPSGKQHDVTSEEVNVYLKDISGQDFTAKDFRTWAGTVHAALALECAPPCSTKIEAKRAIVRAIEQVASALGNTPAVCRKSYVHPVIIDSFLSQNLVPTLRRHVHRAKRAKGGSLSVGEAAVLRFLKDCLVRPVRR